MPSRYLNSYKFQQAPKGGRKKADEKKRGSEPLSATVTDTAKAGGLTLARNSEAASRYASCGAMVR